AFRKSNGLVSVDRDLFSAETPAEILPFRGPDHLPSEVDDIRFGDHLLFFEACVREHFTKLGDLLLETRPVARHARFRRVRNQIWSRDFVDDLGLTRVKRFENTADI